MYIYAYVYSVYGSSLRYKVLSKADAGRILVIVGRPIDDLHHHPAEIRIRPIHELRLWIPGGLT